MISSLTVVTPREVVDRSSYEQNTLRKFEEVTGIKKTRRWKGSATSLALEAALIHDARTPAGRRFDAVVVVTQSPDRKSPCMAVEIHRELMLPPDVPAFDVNQSCCGFIYGLDIARRMVPRGRYALLVCVDKLRAKPGTLDELIFSDAAAVATVEGYRKPAWEVDYITDGEGAEKLCADRDGLLHMDGGAVFDFVTKAVPTMLAGYQEGQGAADFLAQHQPNLSMMRLVEKRSGFPGRALCSIEEYGNMSLCSLPAALAAEEVRILGSTVLMCAYGAGFSAAALSVDWSETPVSVIREI